MATGHGADPGLEHPDTRASSGSAVLLAVLQMIRDDSDVEPTASNGSTPRLSDSDEEFLEMSPDAWLENAETRISTSPRRLHGA